MLYLPVLSVPQVRSLCIIYLSSLSPWYAPYASLSCLVCHPGTQRMHYLHVLFVTQVRSLCITYLSVPQVRNLGIIYLSCLFPRYAAYAPYAPSTCLVCSPGTQRMYHLPVLIVCPLGTDPVHHLLALRRGSHGDCVAAAGPHQTGQRIVRGRPEVVP